MTAAKDIVERLQDLVQQATTERSHYYVAKCAREAIAAIEALRAEVKEESELRERLAEILRRTAAALKGDPPPLTMHSWHDLPERAEALRAERDAAREALRTLLTACEEERWPVKADHMMPLAIARAAKEGT